MQTVTNPFPTNNQARPRDLRGSSPAQAGAGKIHPVDPAAVKRLQTHIAKKRANGRSAAKTARSGATSPPTKPAAVPTINVNPSIIYLPAIIKAAAAEMAKTPKRRRYARVFTPEVVAVWLGWLEAGRSLAWIAQNNGLIPVSEGIVKSHINRQRQAASQLLSPNGHQPDVVPAENWNLVSLNGHFAGKEARPANGAKQSTPTKPENRSICLERDFRQGLELGEVLTDLVQLLNQKPVRIKLNLELEFGE